MQATSTTSVLHTSVPTDDQLPVASSIEVTAPVEQDNSHVPAVVTANTVSQSPSFNLDRATRLDVASFPNQPRSVGGSIPCTIPNLKHFIESYGITVRYDVVRKKLTTLLPGHSGTYENASQVALTQILSLATLNGLSTGLIPEFIDAIGDRNQYNPVANWIISRPWDGTDRLPAFFETLVERESFPRSLKETLVKRWLLSAVAAVLKPDGFHSRGVLTLQGPQSIGKTSWIKALVSDPTLSADLIKLDHHIDAGNKDSVLTAIRHWIVEFGELDSSFKKDIARLKGFLTAGYDKIRRPYARDDSEYPRRTVFCASVNDTNFLVDSTGNSRWWTIPVSSINFKHGIDMQQLYAQLKIEFDSGEQWWLTPEEEQQLEQQNRKHRTVSATFERLLDAIDIEYLGNDPLRPMTAIKVLKEIGVINPSIAQCKECAGFLREHFGESKRINGRDTWRVPLKEKTWSGPALVEHDDDKF